jgi:hypothetical protein
MLWEYESLVQVWIERCKVIQHTLLVPGPLNCNSINNLSLGTNATNDNTYLGKVESSKRNTHGDPLVHRLTQDPTNESIPVQTMFYPTNN